MKIPTLLRKIPWQKGFHFFTEITSRLPTKDDTTINKIVKGLSLLETAKDTFLPPDDPIASFLRDHALTAIRCQPLRHLVFSAAMRDHFTFHTLPIAEKLHFTEARSLLGSLYFPDMEDGVYRHNREALEATYATPGLDLAALAGLFWAGFESGIWLTASGGPGNLSLVIEPLPVMDHPLCGQARQDYDELASFHAHFARAEQPRVYLFVGDPGTGKTSMAMHFASRLRGGVLRLDASALPTIVYEEMGFFLGVLRPAALLMDDVDRIAISGPPTLGMFNLLERLRALHITTLLTVNELRALDPALLRPGRIDRIVFFEVPNAEETAEILLHYSQIKPSPALVQACAGLSHAHLREIALQLLYDPESLVLGRIDTMRRVLEDLSGASPSLPMLLRTPHERGERRRPKRRQG